MTALFAKRLSAVEEYDSTGGYAGWAVRIALVGGTKALEKHLRESDGSTGYGNGRCGRIYTAPDGLWTAFRTVWKTRDGSRKAFIWRFRRRCGLVSGIL